MTENEARSKIKYRIEVAREIAGNGVDGKAFEDLEIAIQALKEIREYRELGTVEELQALKEVDDDLRLQYCYEDLSSSENRGYMQGYNKAIDEFAKKTTEWNNKSTKKVPYEFAKWIAEQMKGGVTLNEFRLESEKPMKEVTVVMNVQVTKILKNVPDCFEMDEEALKKETISEIKSAGYDDAVVEDVKVFERGETE